MEPREPPRVAPGPRLDGIFRRLEKKGCDHAACLRAAETAVILANKALGAFSRALELDETWLGYYTRGNSYIYWPVIFNRTQLGIDDLEKAIAMAEDLPHRSIYGLAWSALGEAYWRLDQRDKMREVWRLGLEKYPGTETIEKRLAFNDEELDAYLTTHFEPSTRVATDLRALWEEPANAASKAAEDSEE